MTKRRPPAPAYSDWQKQAIADLTATSKLNPDDLRIIHQPHLPPEGTAVVKITVRTTDFTPGPGGLPVMEWEELVLGISPSPLLPPNVEVEHIRFAGFAHVLQGQRLCLYLDPSREWNPAAGMTAFLNQLWRWLEDAIAGKFDPSTEMYHAVGGVLHHAEGTPTVVIRAPGQDSKLQQAHLIERTPQRLDLKYGTPSANYPRLPVLSLETGLPFGASSKLSTLLAFVDDPYLDRLEHRNPRIPPQSPALLTALAASASRNPNDAPQYFVFAVPHPAGGGPHLLCGRLPASFANSLRHIVAKQGTAITINPSSVNPNIPIEWCNVSDERPEVTTRRDESRPVNAFQGKDIHVWGCGGIGSWIAEFVTRAGAAHITLCDPGTVTGGLLVRQNYTEDDIGESKAPALARRLRAIRDDLTVDVADGMLPSDPAAFLTTADMIIDATVSIAITQCLDALATIPDRKAIIAQVATDTRTGTLGILTVLAPGAVTTLTELDQNAGAFAKARSDLELYHSLWQEPLSGDELIPTRGCSVPTFHGSAADLAAVAASLTTFLGLQQREPNSGTHLIALPHADEGPRHLFIPLHTS
ncbi:MAG: UBA/THIF-type binding fold [Planctomycetaceae bacterium]|nr:UBA/THIF-type binding fold [Planctomycetaceae bacterium]